MTRERIAATLLLLASLGCKAGSSITSTTTDPTATPTPATTTVSALPAMYSHFGNGVVVQVSGTQVVLKTADLPNHPSPYYGVGNPLYVAPSAGMVVNPNRILSQSFEFRIPASPASATASQTGLGAIGVAVNGVVLFNPYAAGFSALDNEIATFDAYNGHPQQSGQYHYHINPVFLTANDPTALVGVLLDGFPVYGPKELGGGEPSGLDECHGHVSATPDHPSGIYHYHITTSFPYISGCYRGTPGSVTN